METLAARLNSTNRPVPVPSQVNPYNFPFPASTAVQTIQFGLVGRFRQPSFASSSVKNCFKRLKVNCFNRICTEGPWGTRQLGGLRDPESRVAFWISRGRKVCSALECCVVLWCARLEVETGSLKWWFEIFCWERKEAERGEMMMSVQICMHAKWAALGLRGGTLQAACIRQ